MRACVRACMRACVRACVRACMRACVRACVRMCVRACVRDNTHTLTVMCLGCAACGSTTFTRRFNCRKRGGTTYNIILAIVTKPPQPDQYTSFVSMQTLFQLLNVVQRKAGRGLGTRKPVDMTNIISSPQQCQGI